MCVVEGQYPHVASCNMLHFARCSLQHHLAQPMRGRKLHTKGGAYTQHVTQITNLAPEHLFGMNYAFTQTTYQTHIHRASCDLDHRHKRGLNPNGSICSSTNMSSTERGPRTTLQGAHVVNTTRGPRTTLTNVDSISIGSYVQIRTCPIVNINC